MTSTVSPDLRSIFDRLHYEVLIATLKWHTYKGLFSVSQEQSELLDRTANAFFQVCEISFRDDTFITLSRLTDPPQSVGKDNLSLDRLWLLLDKSAHPDFSQKLEQLIGNAKTSCDSIRQYRMRKIAHLDLRTALDSHLEPLSHVTVGDVDRALKSVQEVLVAFSEYMFNTSIMYDFLIQTGGTSDLVDYLRRGEKGFQEDSERRDEEFLNS